MATHDETKSRAECPGCIEADRLARLKLIERVLFDVILIILGFVLGVDFGS